MLEILNNEDRLISLQSDLIIAEILLSDKLIIKNAQQSSSGFFGSIIDGVKSFFSSAIPGETTAEKVLNFIAPGAIYTTLSAMGFGGKLTKILTLAMTVFHIDIPAIFSEIYSKIKSLISGDKKTTSDAVNSIVSAAVSSNMGQISSQEDSTLEQKFKEEVAKLSTGKSYNTSKKNIIKNSYIDFDQLPSKISERKKIRTAKIIRSLLDRNDYLFIKESGWGIANQKATGGILSQLLGFVFSSILASAGFLIAGDAINSMMGRSSALTGTLSNGKPVAGTGKSDAPTAPVATAKKSVKNVKYLSPSYREENYNTSEMWILNVPVDRWSISNMLIGFANEVYSNLKDKTNEMMSSSYFNLLVQKIFNENSEREGSQMLIIPSGFHSKRDLVDFFIDDININTNINNQQTTI